MELEPKLMKVTTDFFDVQVGDTVTRLFYGIEQEMVVTEIDEENSRIVAGAGWMFDRATGIEEDPELGFGVKFGISCSQLIKK